MARRLLLIVLLLTLMTACSPAPTQRVRFNGRSVEALLLKLRYRGGYRAKGGPSLGSGVAVTVAVEDPRAYPLRIGVSQEDRRVLVLARSEERPAKLVLAAVADVLQQRRIRTVRQGQTHSLTVRIVDFSASEKDRFRAQVEVEVELANGSGGVVFRRRYVGRDDTWGSTLNPANFDQVLSRAAAEAVDSAFTDPALAPTLRP